MVYPLLAAYRACEDAAEVERTLGAEHGRVKREYQAVAQPIPQLQFQQRHAHDDASVVRLEHELATRTEQARAYEEALQQLQERRTAANGEMVRTFRVFTSYLDRARAAIRHYRVAKETSEADRNALARYQAKITMSTSYQILESLVGPDEATSVLADGAKPAWLR